MDKNLSTLINSIIDQKKLQFQESEVNFDNSLFEKAILKLDYKKVSIIDYDSIIEGFLNIYKQKLNFKNTTEFIDVVGFIKEIKENFLINGYVYDFLALEKKIWKTFILEYNTKYKCSFDNFLNSLDKENKSDMIFLFIEAYSEVLPLLEIPPLTLYENSMILMEFAKSDVQYNMPLGSILNGIKNTCKTNYDVGLFLLTKSMNIDENKENFLSAIIAGLSENKRNEFYYPVLEDLINKQNKLNAIFYGLSYISELEQIECELFLRLIKNYKSNEYLILSLSSLMISILRSNQTNYYKSSFNELNLLIEKELLANYILSNLHQINNCDVEKTELIINLISKEYFSIEKHINSISNCFWHLKEFETFKKVVLAIIEKKPFESFCKAFASHFSGMNQIQLDEFIIELLTNNLASKRFIGVEIFDELSNYSPYKFIKNVLELPSLTQYKLWISLTLDFHQPKNRLITLLPLLESNSDWVKISFVCKLQELSEDYGGLITKILQENLDLNKPKNIEVIDKISTYIEMFYDRNINIKNSINEINPFFTHYKEIKLFDELFSKKMSESINKGAAQSSLIGILGINTVQLSKGGGWRFGANENISKLTKIESSFSMPRSYFINPDMFELEKAHLSTEDWNDNEFTEIKSFLENE